MKLLKKYNKHKEDGQSMLEFMLVLPVFLLLLFMIIDFGWLFYNMNTVQNVARNAARVACVEYDNTCYETGAGDDMLLVESKEYSLSSYVANTDAYTIQEQHILDQVANTLTSNQDTTKVKISYSGGATLEERRDGDVTVAVTYEIPSFTGIIGSGDGKMSKDFTATSTFKIEKNG